MLTFTSLITSLCRHSTTQATSCAESFDFQMNPGKLGAVVVTADFGTVMAAIWPTWVSSLPRMSSVSVAFSRSQNLMNGKGDIM
jgi:hypothetical protein